MSSSRDKDSATQSHPSESLNFDTIHHDILDPDVSPSHLRHPADALQFVTQPFNITGEEGTTKHPSEALNFHTVHDSLRVGRGAPFGSPREKERELRWTFRDILDQGPCTPSRNSSITFTPISPTTTSPKFGSKHLEWARRMSGTSTAKSNTHVTEDNKSAPGAMSTSRNQPGRVHSINEAFSRLQALPHLNFAQSKAATQKEHSMSLSEGLRTHPKAMLWSLMLSSTLIMEGFDLSLINGFYAFPPFRYVHKMMRCVGLPLIRL